MKRINQLDGLRGLFILLITVNHIENPLNKFTYQPFGFVSAAEGFVFLSGLVAGLVYSKKLDRHGMPAIVQSARQRAWKIYVYHITAFLVVCACLFFFTIYREYWHQDFQSFLNHPVQTLGMGLILLFQPSFLDILPMYCLFLLFLPFLIQQFRAQRTKLVFAASGFLWLISQAGLGFSHKLHRAITPHLPGFELSTMDLLAWQFLFVLGVYIAHRRYQNQEIRISSAWIWASFFIVGVLTIHRHVLPMERLFGLSGQMTWHLTDKQRLGVVRLLNFGALAITLSWLMSRYRTLFTHPGLLLIGKHSLQTFSLHILLVLLGMPLVAHFSGKSEIASVCFVIFSIVCLYLLALWREKHSQATKVMVKV